MSFARALANLLLVSWHGRQCVGLFTVASWEIHMLRKLLALVLLVSLTASMVACETTEGFGKDVKHAGQDIENSADAHK